MNGANSENRVGRANVADRRRGGRFNCRMLTSNFGRVIDLSQCGTRVRSGWLGGVRPGTAVVLCLASDSGQVTLRARAIRKVRVNGGYQTSFQFLAFDPSLRPLLTRMALSCRNCETIGAEAADRLCGGS